jgi:hypothetical protein
LRPFSFEFERTKLVCIALGAFFVAPLTKRWFFVLFNFFWILKKKTNCFLIIKNHHFMSGTTRNVPKAMHVSFFYLVYVSMMNYVLTLDHPLPMDKVKSFRDIFAPCPLCCDVVNSSRCGIWIRLRHIHLFIILSI